MATLILDKDRKLDETEVLAVINEDGTKDHKAAEEIIKTLVSYLDENKDIVAISAPQLGINKRAFAARFENEVKVFIDPVITKKRDYIFGVETSATLPGKELLLVRADKVEAVFLDKELTYTQVNLTGFAARIFAQQCDYLDGLYPEDFALVSNLEEGKVADLTEEELEEAFKVYTKLIELKTQQIGSEVDKNSTEYRQLAFIEKTVHGKAGIFEDPNSPVNKLLKSKSAMRMARQALSKAEKEKLKAERKKERQAKKEARKANKKCKKKN